MNHITRPLLKLVPIEGEYFIEDVLVTHFEQTTSGLPNWRFQYPNCPYATFTKYNGFEIPFDHPVGGHHYYKPIIWRDWPQSLKALSATELLKMFLYVEDIFESFPLSVEEPLGYC